MNQILSPFALSVDINFVQWQSQIHTDRLCHTVDIVDWQDYF